MRKVLFLLIFCVAVFGLTVHDIQYSTTGSSPYDGDTVTISAVVTAIGYAGDKYFIGDAGGGPWSGVYVYDFSHPADAGDRITMTCEVDEFYGLTELKNVISFVIDSSGSVPPPYSTTCAVVETSEALEGVLVTLSNLIVTDDNDTMWEVQDASGLMKVRYGFDYSYVPNPGDTVTTLTGMVYYSRGSFVIEPRFDADIVVSGVPPKESEAEPEINVQAGVLAPTLGEVYTIQFAVQKGNRAILRIFDRMGRSISTLYDGTMYTGASIAWDGRDETNAILPCGVYLIRLESISISGERKFTTKTIAIGSVLK